MYALIPHRWLKYKIITLILLASCQSDSFSKEAKLALPSGKTIDIKLAVTLKEQQRGLSGVLPQNFSKKEGLFFFYLKDAYRSFWMPDTYFDLDIIFLNKNLKVLKILRKIPKHPGKETPPEIFKTGPIFCRHVLEMRADSPLAQEIHQGLTLNWIGRQSLSEIESKIRQHR